MRILHCIPSLLVGGSERKLTYLCPQLLARGWQVEVAFMRPGPFGEPLRRAGVGLHRYAIRHHYDPQLAWRALELTRRLRPDLVQTWMPQMDIVAGAAARLLRIPWIVTEESAALLYPPSLRHLLRHRMVRGASAIVACSAGGADYWRGRVSARVLQKIIPNAVPLEEIDRVAPALPEGVQLQAGEKLILYVGRLSAEKNPAGLVAALGHLTRNFRAVFCGEGAERDRLVGYLHSSGLASRVTLAGHVANVWAVMKRADVLVSLATVEGQPTAILEAMACRCPLVVSDIPAHREFLDEQAAQLVPPGLPLQAAAAIDAVLAAGPAMALQTAEARRRVEALTVDRLGEEYDRFYRFLLAGRFDERRPSADYTE